MHKPISFFVGNIIQQQQPDSPIRPERCRFKIVTVDQPEPCFVVAIVVGSLMQPRDARQRLALGAACDVEMDSVFDLAPPSRQEDAVPLQREAAHQRNERREFTCRPPDVRAADDPVKPGMCQHGIARPAHRVIFEQLGRIVIEREASRDIIP